MVSPRTSIIISNKIEQMLNNNGNIKITNQIITP